MSIVIDYTKGFFEAAPSGETVGDIAGSATLDLATGNVFSYTPAADTTFVFSNPPATGTAYGMTLKVTGADVASGGFDLANASYDGVSYDAGADTPYPRGTSFKPDGTVFFVVEASGDEVNQYSLSTAWDISTASYVQSFSVNAQDPTPQGLFVRDDGLKMYITGYDFDNVYEYSLSTAWDVSTSSYVRSFSVATQDAAPSGVFFKPDGTKMYVVGSSPSDSIHEYSLSTAWNISTASFVQSFSVAAQETNPGRVFIDSSGTKVFISGTTTNDGVYEYNLSTAWDISTASYVQFFSTATEASQPTGFTFKPDGTKMYIGNNVTGIFYQYSTTSLAPATLTYPTSVDWPAATAPDAPAAGETDVYTFYTTDGGTTYYGFQVGDAMA